MKLEKLPEALTQRNMTLGTLCFWLRDVTDTQTVRIAFDEYLAKNPKLLIGYKCGSDNYVLGTVVKRTKNTITLSDGAKVNWSGRRCSYMYEKTLPITINAEKYLDPSF